VQAQRRYPLHAKVVRQAEASLTSEEDALAPFLHGSPPTAGEQAAGAAYRRWCADRVAAGELHVLSALREDVSKWACRVMNMSSVVMAL